jgi:hypothetical protein
MEFVPKAKELEKGCLDTISMSVHIGSCEWGVGPLLLSPGDASKMLEYHLGISDMCGVSIECRLQCIPCFKRLRKLRHVVKGETETLIYLYIEGNLMESGYKHTLQIPQTSTFRIKLVIG